MVWFGHEHRPLSNLRPIHTFVSYSTFKMRCAICGEIRLMLLQTADDPALPRLNIFTEFFDIGLAGFGKFIVPFSGLSNLIFAGGRQFGFMLLHAFYNPALTGPDIFAEFLNISLTGTFCVYRLGMSWR
jgi:hypothetical protein